MKIKDWIQAWEKRVPTSLQEDWDNSGLQAGRVDRDLSGIVFSLDVTQEAINTAKENGANLLVTHHPILFTGAKEISERRKATAYILECIEEGITIYAAHTNFDKVAGGVNDVLADLCGLEDIEPLEASVDDINQDGSLGRLGTVAKTTLDAYGDWLKERIALDHLLIYGDSAKEISKVAVVGGSGASYADLALEKGADLLITGDVKYHDAVDAVEAGLALIDLGHYESEKPALDVMAAWTREISPEINQITVGRHEASRRRIR